MGWQDREYAQPTSGRAWSAPGRTRLIGGSVVTTLIVINIVIYVLAKLGPAMGEWIYGNGAMQAQAVLRGQVWRLFTAQYLHDWTGVWHLLMNMLVLHFLGRPLERMWSPRKFFAVYTLCGLAGYVFYTILGLRGVIDPHTPAVGASGCIFGLLGIAAVLFPNATVYVYMLFPIKIRTAAMIFGGIAFLTILERGSNFGGEACHLAGLAFGVWWAMKGDAWWSRSRWSVPRIKRRRVMPAPTSSFSERIKQRRHDVAEVDRILKKVYEKGVPVWLA